MTDHIKIRALNDEFRKTLIGGQVVFMANLAGREAKDLVLQHRVLGAVRVAPIEEGNDPYGEADFGSVEVDGEQFFWKIDYYDRAMEFGSDDPADPSVTCRVLSIFYAYDY
ncbi:DUF3768 domain-containing protein [Mesorhizobium sp. M0320]|uniref:DUF3768 domain-containing protein n=1 Tax=Mesorhizobium sp. M0320 TaxID=2956936 RepID=UPI0033388B2D